MFDLDSDVDLESPFLQNILADFPNTRASCYPCSHQQKKVCYQIYERLACQAMARFQNGTVQ